MTREIFKKGEAGTAGEIIQHCDDTLKNLPVADPCIVLVESGQKIITGKETSCSAAEGQFVLIWGRTIIDITNIKPKNGLYKAKWIAWKPDLIKDYVFRRPAERINSSPVCAITDMNDFFMGVFIRAYSGLTDSSVPEEIASVRMTEVLTLLDINGLFCPPSISEPIAWKVRRLLSREPSKKWKIENIAKEMGMSESTLKRKVAMNGVSVSDIITDVRMSYALSLLQSTDMSVTRVASEAGYGCLSRFSTRFRSRFGFSPSYVRGKDYQE